MAFQDLSGQKFGKLTAIKVVGKSKKGESIWECLCDCGNITKSTCSNLKRGHTKSCGCYKKVCCVTHHETKTRLYKIWKGIKTRCYIKSTTMAKLPTAMRYKYEEFSYTIQNFIILNIPILGKLAFKIKKMIRK